MNAPATQQRQAITAAPSKVEVLRLLDKQAPAIAMALPKFMDPDHFRRVVMTEIRKTPKLLKCDPVTVIGACMLAAQLGLEPGPLGQCYLIPRYNGKTQRMECVFQWGYKGLLAMSHRSGQVQDVTLETVYSNDVFDRKLGDEAGILHIPAPWGKDRGEPIGFYCVLRTKDGGNYRSAMSMDEMIDHAKTFSQSYDEKKDTFYGPWQDHFEAMAKKTVLMQALKLAPMSIEFMRGLEKENVPQALNTEQMQLDHQDDDTDEQPQTELIDTEPTKETKTEKVKKKVANRKAISEVEDLINAMLDLHTEHEIDQARNYALIAMGKLTEGEQATIQHKHNLETVEDLKQANFADVVAVTRDVLAQLQA